ncbi:MAG TPA: hypothetical protein VH987_09535, partial [Candidatus Limnocylindria bacterium]
SVFEFYQFGRLPAAYARRIGLWITGLADSMFHVKTGQRLSNVSRENRQRLSNVSRETARS